MMSKRYLLVFILLAIISASFAGVARADVPRQLTCELPGRLVVGGSGRVLPWPNLPNRLRNSPSIYGGVIGFIKPGATFSVISWPHCENGVLWWQVNYNGSIGWTAEGNLYGYYLEPIGNIPQPPPPASCVLPNRLTIGGVGRVIPGLPNVVRDAPGTQSTGANSRVIGEIPGGGVFTVINGPLCGSDGRWWWYVNYNGLIGWTGEGEGYSSYWVEPWSTPQSACPGFLPSRLAPYGVGRVTVWPNYPNRLRAAPGYHGGVIGEIPAGGVFNVLNGPHCAENTAWWQVSYNGVTGWTSEGSGSTYYLEPI